MFFVANPAKLNREADFVFLFFSEQFCFTVNMKAETVMTFIIPVMEKNLSRGVFVLFRFRRVDFWVPLHGVFVWVPFFVAFFKQFTFTIYIFFFFSVFFLIQCSRMRILVNSNKLHQ